MARSTILITLLAGALTLAGCGGNSDDSAITGTPRAGDTSPAASASAPPTSSPAEPDTATPTASATDPAPADPASSAPVPPGPAPTDPAPTDPAGGGGPDCRVDPHAPAVTAAIDALPGGPWAYGGESNYNPCAQLSYAVAETPRGTGSSPRQFALFHDGTYIGTTTSCAYGLTSVVGANENSMTVRYRWPRGDESNAGGTGLAISTYTWDGSRVVMDPPFPADMPGTSC